MGFGIKLHVWGERACFTRPEMKGERVSYDVITPSACKGILEAIYWKPAIKWIIDSICILNPIIFDSVRRNELGSKIPPGNISQAMKGKDINLHQDINKDRQQRATLYLRDVAYIIDAHFEIDKKNIGPDDTKEKHYNMAIRRMRSGQCFHQPFFGCHEFSASFKLIEDELNIPKSHYHGETRDLGWMLKDIDYTSKNEPSFFRATMKDGIVEVPL